MGSSKKKGEKRSVRKRCPCKKKGTKRKNLKGKALFLKIQNLAALVLTNPTSKPYHHCH